MSSPKAIYKSPYVLLTATCMIWAFNWIIGRAIVDEISPFVLTFGRWAIAIAIMLPLAWPSIRAHRAQIRRHWKTIAWLGFWGTGLHNAFAYVGLHYTTATNGLLLNSSIPVQIILLAWLFYRETITPMQAGGVAISLCGVLAILARGDPEALARIAINKGDLIVLAGTVFWAAYTVFLRMKPDEIPSLAFLACCGCVGVVLLAPLAIVELFFFGGYVNFGLPMVSALLYVGIFPSVVAYMFWTRAVAEVGPNVAGVFFHLIPLVGVLFAWLFLGEQIHNFHVFGMVLILTGIALTTRGHRLTPEPGPE